MYKVLIAEDVDIVREDLKKIINWEAHGFTIVGEAKNGEVGLAMFQEYKPDIIITDIRMPVMTGIEMISFIRKLSGEARFILLTAFEEFEYAKAALNLNVQSYVMKYELDDEVLLRELKKQTEVIERQNSIGRMEKSANLKKILEDGGADAKQAGFFMWFVRNALLVVELLLADKNPLRSEQDIQARMQEEIRRVCGHEPERYEFELIELSPVEHIVFLKAPESMSANKSSCFIRAFSSLYQSILRGKYGVESVISIGGYVYAPNEIPQVYHHGKSIARQRVFFHGSCVLDSLAPEPLPEFTARVCEELNLIRHGINELDAAFLEEKTTNLFVKLLAPARSNELLDYCVRELTYALAAHDANKETENLSELLGEIMDYSRSASIFELSDMFIKTIRTMGQAMGDRYSKRVQSIIRHIDENYNSEISLRTLAGHLDLSVIYISQIFKKEVGVTISSYITRLRVQKAIALLETGKYKVYEVSVMVGYQTVQYFSKIFKKETGKKPGEFIRS